jgi:hypothetical protein
MFKEQIGRTRDNVFWTPGTPSPSFARESTYTLHFRAVQAASRASKVAEFVKSRVHPRLNSIGSDSNILRFG